MVCDRRVTFCTEATMTRTVSSVWLVRECEEMISHINDHYIICDRCECKAERREEYRVHMARPAEHGSESDADKAILVIH